MNRRTTLAAIGAVGIAAAGAGAWVARRLADDAGELSATSLFAQTLPDPEDRAQPLAQWKGKLLVVNFWATWCAPCIEEMPDLQKVRDAYAARGVEVIGVGIDTAPKIREFRDNLKLTLPLLVAGAGGAELSRQLGNTAGALPYTVLVGRDGAVLQRRLGALKRHELAAWLDRHLASSR